MGHAQRRTACGVLFECEFMNFLFLVNFLSIIVSTRGVSVIVVGRTSHGLLRYACCLQVYEISVAVRVPRWSGEVARGKRVRKEKEEKVWAVKVLRRPVEVIKVGRGE